MLPVLDGRVATCGVPVSVDTGKPEVMRAALDARRRHRQRHPRAARRPGRSRRSRRIRVRRLPDAHAGRAGDDAGGAALRRRGRRGRATSCASARARAASRRASRRERIVLDPGIGFGKTVGAQPRRCCARCATAGARAARCWSAGRASRALGAHHRAAGRRAAGGQRGGGAGSRCSAARASCACTTWRRRSMRWRCWRQSGARPRAAKCDQRDA